MQQAIDAIVTTRAYNNIPVDYLPSQLNEEQKARWEEMKSKRLR